MRYRMQFDPRPGAILTRRAAAEFLGQYFEELDELPFQLVREIEPVDDGDEFGGPAGNLGPSTRSARSGCGPQSGPDKTRRAELAARGEYGALNFTSVEPDDIDTIHDSLPCGAEIREFVRQYECWQLWVR